MLTCARSSGAFAERVVGGEWVAKDFSAHYGHFPVYTIFRCFLLLFEIFLFLLLICLYWRFAL